MRIALIQMPVLPDKVKNIQTACGKIREAAKNGADFAVLPEMFCCPYDNSCFGAYGEPEGGEAQTALSHLAAELGLYLVGGTVPELSEGRIYNTSYVYGPDGRQLAKHRKAHLFDIDVQGGQRFRESDTLSPGNAITTFETAFGTMGLCVCFDLRFEELARCMCLRGAKVIFVPAAFNMTTGPAHWELLFRQRAVDNQCFTVGVSPARDEQGSYVAYGNSIAVDPWGAVLCRAGAEETTLYADLDVERLEAIRAQLPILSARRKCVHLRPGGAAGRDATERPAGGICHGVLSGPNRALPPGGGPLRRHQGGLRHLCPRHPAGPAGGGGCGLSPGRHGGSGTVPLDTGIIKT